MPKHKSKPNKPNAGQATHKEKPPVVPVPTDTTEKTHTPADGEHPQKGMVKMTFKTRLLWFWRTVKTHTTANRVMAAFTIVIAVTAIEQGCVYYLQLTEMRIGQRPWLKIKFLPLKMAVNTSLCAPVTMLNTGKTPAKHIEGMMVVRNVPISDPIDFRHPPISDTATIQNPPLGVFAIARIGVIFPDDPVPFESCLMEANAKAIDTPMTWTDAMQSRFDLGSTYVDVHGEFNYDDASGRQHWTRFCFVTVGNGMATPLQIARSCIAYSNVDEN